jgi:hypothetical protein
MRILFILLSSLMPFTITAQLTIASGSVVKFAGAFSTPGSINVSSAQADFSAAHVYLTGTDQTLTTSSPLTLQGLTIDGGGAKTTNGELIITRDLLFTLGVLTPGSGTITYSGTTTLNGNTSSFVNGTLFQLGSGVRYFPIGVGNTYIPMRLNDVQDAAAEVGVTAFTSGTSLVFPPDVSSVANNRRWEVLVNAGSLSGSSASLYIPGSSVEGLQPLVVIEADNSNGATAINVGGGTIDQFVTSLSPITKPILTIGIGGDIEVQILDLITPYNKDEVNDGLQIVNVDYATDNKVTLLDRWGDVVKEWVNYRNNDTFDFSALSPGNYICVLEYQLSPSSPRAKMSQMISILKGN